jgi:DNA polymerase III subunit delta'
MWQHIRGHDRLIQSFSRAIERNRLAHAYLFVGPEGVGKKLLAVELAKAILCEGKAAKFEACDQCTSCTLIEAGTHPDFFTVSRPEESHEIPIEIMRGLCRDFAMKSARGKGKVAVLDDADDLNEESANCFLKTLEEPPPRSVFILIGTSAERQLPTIVSRCQVIRFPPLPRSLVLDLLRARGITDEEQRARLARLCEGSPGQAMALAHPELWKFRQTLLAGLVRRQPDSVALSRTFVHFVEEAGKDSASQRRRAALVVRLLIDFFRDALAMSQGGLPKPSDAEEEKLLQELCRLLDADAILAALDRCFECEFHLDRYVHLVLTVESLLDALAQKLPA